MSGNKIHGHCHKGYKRIGKRMQCGKVENVRIEVPHRWELSLGFTFYVIKGSLCFL